MPASPVKAGRLNRRIAVLRQAAGSDDGYGIAPGALQRLCWRLASVQPVRGREGSEAGGVAAKPALTAWLQHDATTRLIRATDSVAIDGRIHEITEPRASWGCGRGSSWRWSPATISTRLTRTRSIR